MSALSIPASRPARPLDGVLATGVIATVGGATFSLLALEDAESALWHVSAAVTVGAAAVVHGQRPHHRLAAWFCLMAALLPIGFFLADFLRWAADQQAPPVRLAWLNFGLRLSDAVSLAVGIRVIALYPDGLIRDRLERAVSRAAWAVLLVPGLLLLATPRVVWPAYVPAEPVANPLHAGGIAIGVDAARMIVDITNLGVVLAVVLLLRRYRRATRDERERIRWLLLPVIVAGFGGLAALLVAWPNAVLGAFWITVISTVGASIAMGLVRPGGIDVDNVLRRSIAYGLLWLLIASLFVAVSAIFGIAVGGRLSVGWAIAVTVLAMLALQPLRSALEHHAGHRLFGRPPDPRRAIARLGDSLAGTYDLETLLSEVATALEEGLGVQWARVRLTPGAEPGDLRPALAVPIVLDGETLGVVECGPKLSGELDTDDAALVATLARQAALAVRNVRLTTQLSAQADELAASRARLVRAEEAERRRIERDIHDGVQQELVALIGHTGLIRRRLRRDATIAADELDELQSGLSHVLAELRELASGIHPSLLRDRGLLPAVEALAARHPVPVSVRADPELRDLRLPDEIEGAAYYTVAESLANSLKHADAHQLDVVVSRSDGTLAIRIGDNGDGFDPAHTSGNGLTNLAERLQAIGGTLTVVSEVGRGTTVSATMPSGDRQPAP